MAFEYSAKEFIKVYRKLLNWEWYKDANTKALFIHCLLCANWKPGVWQGIPYNAGEFITSLPSLADESGLTIRQTRTSLNHLIATGELTSSSINRATGKKLSKCRIITVNNWDSYQGSDRQASGKTTGRYGGDASTKTTGKTSGKSTGKKEADFAENKANFEGDSESSDRQNDRQSVKQNVKQPTREASGKSTAVKEYNKNTRRQEVKEKEKKEKFEQLSADAESDLDDDDEWLTGDELQAKWDAEGGPYGTV